MKYFFLFVFFLLPVNFSFAGEIFFCSEDDVVGFNPKRSYAVENYNTSRFKAYIDFNDKKFVSEKIYFGENHGTTCTTSSVNPSLYCISRFGSAIAVNRETLRFHFSSVYNKSDQMDEIYLSYGFCEKF